MDKHIILGVHITDRVKHVAHVQEALTKFGCYIKTRLGLHEASKEFCAPTGVLVLEMLDDDKKVAGLKTELEKIEGVEVKEMVFDHP
ncbi:MAG: hypothetical protein AB7T27_08465 [Kiritimatiellia bacterium]